MKALKLRKNKQTSVLPTDVFIVNTIYGNIVLEEVIKRT